MYKLYYSPGACSMAIHVVLNELGVPFEAVNVSIPEGKNKSKEFLKVNPRGQVPVLVDGDQVIREGAAILIYLLDKHGSPLLPSLSINGGKDRATALEWLCFANATMHPAYGKAFFIKKNVSDPTFKEQLFKVAFTYIESLWADVDTQLAKTPYVCGKEITAADIVLTVLANFNSFFTTPIVLGPNVKRLLKEIIKRPSYQEALKTEQVEYKAAA